MALLAAQQALVAGKLITFSAATAGAGGDTFAFAPNTALHVKNGSGASINVTVEIPGNTEFGVAQPDVVFAVPAGAHGVFQLARGMVDTATGLIKVTYSAVTTVTVAVIAQASS